MDHDAAWKHLFGLPVTVRHLLRGFADEVAELLDLDSLRQLPANWVAADGEQRHGDIAWRAWYADGSGRSLVLLIEFQSTADPDMATRVSRYEGAAFHGLRRNGALDPDGELRLLSVVIFSGSERWTAPGGTTRLAVTGDGEVAPHPPYRYLFLDSRPGPQDDLAKSNVVVAVLWLGGASSPADASQRLRALANGWLERGDVAAAEAVLDWLGILWPRLFPDADAAAPTDWRRELRKEEEGMSTLAERVKEWEADLLERGIERGLERGIERGIEDQRALLCRQAERKFGAQTAHELARHLANVMDAEGLVPVGEWIIDCDDGAALLELANGLG